MHDTLNTGRGFVPVIVAPQTPQTPSWSAKDVAKYWGVKPNTVYHWVYDGKLTAHKTPGGRLRFIEAEVKAAQVKREES